jgi:hypothetical protein
MTPEHKLFTGKANGSKDLPAQKRSKFNYRTSNPDLPPVTEPLETPRV